MEDSDIIRIQSNMWATIQRLHNWASMCTTINGTTNEPAHELQSMILSITNRGNINVLNNFEVSEFNIVQELTKNLDSKYHNISISYADLIETIYQMLRC